MALLRDKAQRDAIRSLKAQIREIERPEVEARKIERAKSRAKREKGLARSQGQRQPRERDNGYLQFLRRQPCQIGPRIGDPCEGPMDAMHLRFSDAAVGRVNPGKGRKSHDRWALSGCRKHHAQQHAFGDERRFWSEVVNADPNEISAALYRQYRGEAG